MRNLFCTTDDYKVQISHASLMIPRLEFKQIWDHQLTRTQKMIMERLAALKICTKKVLLMKDAYPENCEEFLENDFLSLAQYYHFVKRGYICKIGEVPGVSDICVYQVDNTILSYMHRGEVDYGLDNKALFRLLSLSQFASGVMMERGGELDQIRFTEKDTMVICGVYPYNLCCISSREYTLNLKLEEIAFLSRHILSDVKSNRAVIVCESFMHMQKVAKNVLSMVKQSVLEHFYFTYDRAYEIGYLSQMYRVEKKVNGDLDIKRFEL